MSAKVTLKLTGWKEFEMAIKGPKFEKALQKHVGRATTKSAQMLQKEVRKTIKQADFTKNAMLTVAIKRSSKPLVDRGDLWQAVKAVTESWKRATVGIKYMHNQYDIAKLLHDGGTVPVTEKMRTMFFYLWLASMSEQGLRTGPAPVLSGRAAELFERFQDWKPLRPSTRAIRIPARPFITNTVKKQQKAVIDRWREAVDAAFKEVARK